MSNDTQHSRRNRTMLIVEGFHEKEKLFKSLLMAFNELSIKEEDIWVYHTNVYDLIEKLKNEYGEYWYEMDIDLPLLLSDKTEQEQSLYKSQFTDIFLIFDYERQDGKFSSEDIENMQKLFSDSTDNGKLYINYPMVESYWDFKSIPDETYLSKKVSSSIKKGSEYKNAVGNSGVKRYVVLPSVLIDILVSNGLNERIGKKIVDALLEVDAPSLDDLEDILKRYEANTIKDNTKIKHLLMAKYREALSIELNQNYLKGLRILYKYIIKTTLLKIQTVLCGDLDSVIYDALELLKNQNFNSLNTDNGFIWVINTAVTIITDYNSNLIEND